MSEEKVTSKPTVFYHYCPRLNVEVVIINNKCLFVEQSEICEGCAHHGKEEK